MNWKSLFRVKPLSAIQADLREMEESHHGGMVKNLKMRDLIALGIAAIVGAGIFSTIGTACVNGGPAVIFLFIFTAVACVFSALCYAEFASSVPISGSAYTYSYTTLGEVVAWTLGWNLVFEYAIGNIAVAISWSDYFTNLLSGIGIHLPAWATMDYNSAKHASDGVGLEAWNTAPNIGGLRLVADFPALLITMLITLLIIRGIKESKQASNIMVAVKLIVIAAVIIVGSFYVNPGNWSPFAPNGAKGVLMGVSSVFFAYIGFDAISTTAEECKDPQRDLPRAMFWALAICTVLYVLLVLVLTGMVPYEKLGVGDPLAFAFGEVGLNRIEGIIAASAVFAMASVFLVFQIGQPRIWMAMSRDGLLPKKFSQLHPRYKTPAFSSWFAAALVAIPMLFMNITEVTALCSIGTLFAFALVSGGLLLLQGKPDRPVGGFRVPYISGQFIIPVLFLVFLYYRITGDMVAFDKDIAGGMAAGEFFYHRIPVGIFIAIFGGMAWISFRYRLSLIPVLGVLTNVYLMSELGTDNWVRFIIWCGIGFVIYGLYSYHNSKLAKNTARN